MKACQTTTIINLPAIKNPADTMICGILK